MQRAETLWPTKRKCKEQREYILKSKQCRREMHSGELPGWHTRERMEETIGNQHRIEKATPLGRIYEQSLQEMRFRTDR